MSYLLDANVFIQAKNLHYGLDFCPAFWQWIVDKNQQDKVFSIDKISDEINSGADELSDWANQYASQLFNPTDATVLPHLGTVSQWATSQQYEPAAINGFLQVADYYLIAHALAGSHTIVTHEIPSNSVKRIKIPNACMGLNIKFITPYKMLRREQARFILGAQHNAGGGL